MEDSDFRMWFDLLTMDVRQMREERRMAEMTNREAATEKREENLRAALLAILDAVDYTNSACKPNEMVGAVLPEGLIKQARKALQK